jgi:hypothetical protein
MGRAGTAAPTGADSRLAIRRQLATTPGRLRLAAALLALAAIVFGVAAVEAAGTRHDAVGDVATTEPLLVSAVDLSASLSDAHAIAALSFLVGGPEPAVSRRSYARALGTAGARVAQLAREVGSSPESAPAVRRITQRLPVYAGLIDSARANNRRGFPVGGAYLRRASNTMRGEILPAARDLYKLEAQQLTTSYRAGVSLATILAVVLAGLVLLALVGTTQVFITRTTHRLVNVRLALATTILLGLLAWIVVAFVVQQQALAKAQRTGSDAVELLTAARILASRAQANESIALSARGGGEGEPRLADADRGFEAVVKPIGADRSGAARGSGGLLDAAAAIAGGEPGRIDAIYDAYRRYLASHRRVVDEETRGDFTRAVQLAVNSRTDGTPSTKRAAADLNAALASEVRRAQRRFDHAASRAESALGGLQAGIPLLTVLCALLALLGVRERLEEYR